MAIARPEGPGGGQDGVMVAVAAGRLAAVEEFPGKEPQQRQHGIQHGNVHQLAPAAFFPLQERQHNALYGHQPGGQVGDGRPGPQGAALLASGYAHEPGEPLDDLVERRIFPAGPGLAETGHAAIDQPREIRSEGLVFQAEFGHGAGLEVFHHHVRAGQQFLNDPPAFRVLQVDGQALLVAVEVQVSHRHSVGARTEVAGAVALQRLQLDHFRAHVAQHLRAKRPGEHLGEVQHLVTGKRHEGGQCGESFS